MYLSLAPWLLQKVTKQNTNWARVMRKRFSSRMRTTVPEQYLHPPRLIKDFSVRLQNRLTP